MPAGFSGGFAGAAFLTSGTAAPARRPQAVGHAIVALLGADPVLASLMPDGVWLGVAPAGSRRFVLVSFVTALDTPQFRARAFEDHLYHVRAVALRTGPADLVTAAARIDAVLDPVGLPAALAVEGYRLMVSRRVAAIDEVDPDAGDSSIRWAHLGGRYQIMVAPMAAS